MIAKQLLLEDYAVIGNLYSPTRGIGPLIRNLLANPHVRYLVILDATREDKNAGDVNKIYDNDVTIKIVESKVALSSDAGDRFK